MEHKCGTQVIPLVLAFFLWKGISVDHFGRRFGRFFLFVKKSKVMRLFPRSLNVILFHSLS